MDKAGGTGDSLLQAARESQQSPQRQFTAPPRPVVPNSRLSTQRNTDSYAMNHKNNQNAVAMAAVAVVASASNESPSAAAEKARIAARSLGMGEQSHLQTTLQEVDLAALKDRLLARSETVDSAILKKLANGENDPFLQHLLLLVHVRATSQQTEEPGETENEDDAEERENNLRMVENKLLTILSQVEAAYHSLTMMLPSVDSAESPLNRDIYLEADDPDSAVVVADLLPPCTSVPGDPTVEFFRECMGETSQELHRDDSLSQDSSEMTPKRPSTKKSSSQKGIGSSMFSGMFSQSRKQSKSPPRKSFGNVFRKRSSKHGSSDSSDSFSKEHCRPGEYTVLIEREMLGLTVENVLERTVVRTVLGGGPAKKAGAKVGSLIVKVGNVETKNFTHFETIDELRQSQRPLQLVLRQISDDALRAAREEMGRLIKGGGFGNIIDGEPPRSVLLRQEEPSDVSEEQQQSQPVLSPNIDAYTKLLRRRWIEAIGEIKNKKEESLARVGEKLVWILTLLVIGLEKESSRLLSLFSGGVERRNTHSQYHHTAKDYADGAKSVSKVLFDFVKKKLDSRPKDDNSQRKPPPMTPQPGGARGGRGPGAGRRPIPGILPGAAPPTDSVLQDEKPLLQIGEVLHRTRTFLADPTAPPAALLRGEVIAFLCDLLDVDTEMELSEDEAVSSASGGKGGAINDLGSAGNLLKLIVLNCAVMRSPGCDDMYLSTGDSSVDPELAEEMKRRFGASTKVTDVDLHRLHAGNRFLAVVHRLAASRSTSARITACSLGPVLWGYLDFPHQLQLRGVITRALHDVEVLVRKSTATVLHEIAELVFDPRAVPWLVLMCERAMTDPEPLLRSAAMTLTWHLAEHLPNAFLGDASQGSRFVRRLPPRSDPIFADVYLLQCKLLPVATRLAEDRAPSVRLAVAAQCDRLCDALGDHWSNVIVDVLLALLSDSDERVRSEAVLCAPRLAEIVLLSSNQGGSEFSVLDVFLPVSIRLQKDSSSAVRASLATASGELLTLLVGLQSLEAAGEAMQSDSERSSRVKQFKKHVDERLIPLVQKLLHDPDPEVTSAALRAVTNASRGTVREIRARLQSTTSEDDTVSISSHASREKTEPVFIPVLSESQVLRLLPTLSELANSRQWRVRQSAVEIVPALLGCTHKFETRAEISNLCVRLMEDQVDAVRRTAAECLCLGGGSLGSHGEDVRGEWMTAIVIPHLRACSSHPNSKQRLLSLKMVEVILQNGACPAKWFYSKADAAGMSRDGSPIREMVEIALSLISDRIANVRLNVGRVLGTVLYVFEENELRLIEHGLQQQIDAENARDDGGDRDVLFFAKKCLNRARLRLEEEDQYGQNQDSHRVSL